MSQEHTGAGDIYFVLLPQGGGALATVQVPPVRYAPSKRYEVLVLVPTFFTGTKV